jgi:hypothetical protein
VPGQRSLGLGERPVEIVSTVGDDALEVGKPVLIALVPKPLLDGQRLVEARRRLLKPPLILRLHA